MILPLLLACTAELPRIDPPTGTHWTTDTGTPTVPPAPTTVPSEDVLDPCVADPGCLHPSEAPFHWTYTPDPTDWTRATFLDGGDLDYTGDGVPDALVALDGVVRPGLRIVAGPLARDVALDDAPIVEGVWGTVPAGDVDGDGTGDLILWTDDYEASGLAFGPFDVTGPTIPWVAAWRPPYLTGLLRTDGPGGPLYAGMGSGDRLTLYRGPLAPGLEPYATIFPPYLDIYQDDAWLHALPDGHLLVWSYTEERAGCFTLGDAPAGEISPGEDDRVDDAACTALGMPDQDGDGAPDVWWGGSVYRSIGADHAPVDLLGPSGEPIGTVPDVSGDGVEDLVVRSLAAELEVELRASGLGEPAIQRYGVATGWGEEQVVGGVLLVPMEGAIAVFPLAP